MIDAYVKSLVEYGVSRGLIEEEDKIYTRNSIMDILKMDSYDETSDYVVIETKEQLEEVLKGILEYALEKGLISEDSVVLKDLFDTKIMNTLVPKPSQVIKKFWEEYKVSPKAATDYYYELSKNSDYIRTYRVAKDKKWVSPSAYGDIDITINLSKPEKDPKMIALARTMKSSSYPKCQLCIENEGYAGRLDHPARENHRIIPVEIYGGKWGFQYSPYVYYNEHCIVFNGEHVPMQINRATFCKLFDFIKQFPHYIVGSNADLPIVGGSILSHDHFQGGNYEFAMAKAPVEKNLAFKGFEDIDAGIVKWPMSVIRLSGTDSDRIIDLAVKILVAWRSYTDMDAVVYAYTDENEKVVAEGIMGPDDGAPAAFTKDGKEAANITLHNTITPIARMRDGRYELDLVLRNNITMPEHPLGLYHPWEEYHHIKKENIGLIEVMGLAVLPARLKAEMEELAKAIVEGKDIRANETLEKHADWVDSFKGKYSNISEENIDTILQDEIGLVFQKVLECAGVYKRDEEGSNAFARFIDYVNEQ